jgi:hypothetical protein
MKRININRIALGLAWLIVYTAAGVAAGLAIWYFVTQTVELWRYDQVWVSTAFLVVLMAAGYAVPEVLERLQGWINQSGAQASKGGWGKSFRLLVSAILVPVAVFIAANRVSWLSTPLFPPPSDEYKLVTQVGDTVRASSSSATRVAGVEALGAISSKDSLAMLTKIVEQQPSILEDQDAYTALAKAIASYGPQAKSWLLSTFQAHSQPAGQESGDRTLDFVLDTLANTKLTNDSAIWQLAKQVAGNAAYGVGTRGRAILLVGQFGAPQDSASLLPYLQDPDESVRAAALVAVKNLYQKSNPPSPGSASK